MDAERVGATAAAVFFLLLPGWFCLSAWRAKERSLRLANLALACGFFAVGHPERLLPVEGAVAETLRIGTPFVMVLIATAGLLLAALALWARRADGGTGVVRPVIGLVLCLVIGVSNGFISLVTQRLDPAAGQPWEWTSARYGYRVRLPSEDCVESSLQEVDGAFDCGAQRMHATVLAQQADAAGYTAAVRELRAKMFGSDSLQGEPVLENTRTEAGWPCTRVTIVERARDRHGPILVSIAIIHWPEKRLLFTVMFEGALWPTTAAGRAQVHEHFTRSAQGIHLSLGPAERTGAVPPEASK